MNNNVDSNTSNTASLFEGKVFTSWNLCDSFLNDWGKNKGFGVIKDRVTKEGGFIRKRTYICEHGKKYTSKSNKDISTKKLSCPWHLNASCPKGNNPDSLIYVTTAVDEHNHELNLGAVAFNEEKRFSDEMMEDVQFLTNNCKMGATAQRKYLEAKYPSHPMYSKDLYAAIQNFRPTTKSLSNDAAKMSNWLDEQKEKDSRWVVARGWDDDNTLTHLVWMTPGQVENWIQFSDCVINDVTHKTNRYGMALSLFVGFNSNMQNVLLAQALLIDESKDSHSWLFKQILEATGIHPTVILTDSDPAVDAAVREVFINTYPIHCAFHITQNLHKNLRKPLGDQYGKFIKDFYHCRNSLVQSTFSNRFAKLMENYPQSKSYLERLYESKGYWAHSYTSFRFTGGMIASSRVESVNACIKRMLFNSNVSLCELMSEIHKLLDEQDKKNRYQYWKLAIPSVKSQEKANFLFTEVDKCCQSFLTPAVLKLQRDEINQSLFYTASLVEQWDTVIEGSYDEECAENPQATIDQLLEIGGRDNVKEIWEIMVGNSLKAKHYVVLLKNEAHLCSCLMAIRKGIVCRHYFQIMLSTNEAKFHIRLIPSRWYQEGKDPSYESFIVADKFSNMIKTTDNAVNNHLCPIDKEKEDFLKERMNLLDERLMYGNLHGTYKKALQKALQKKSRSLRLIGILEEFTNLASSEDEDDSDEDENSDNSDKENTDVFQLQNPKVRRGKGRPAGTRRYKASHEKDKITKKQRRCLICGNLGHYQKNCKGKA
jgi:MULE transposase domain